MTLLLICLPLLGLMAQKRIFVMGSPEGLAPELSEQTKSEIMQALSDTISKYQPDCVLIPGEQPIVMSGTSAATCGGLFSDEGRNKAKAVDAASQSYACEPLPNLLLLCVAGDGQLPLSWMLEQADRGHAAGKQVIAMMNPCVVEHFDGQSTPLAMTMANDWEYAAAQLAAHGIGVVFTGGYPALDVARRNTTEDQSQWLYSVATGSPMMYPNGWRLVTVNEYYTEWKIQTGYITAIPSDPQLQKTSRAAAEKLVTDSVPKLLERYWPQIEALKDKLMEDYGSMIKIAGIKLPESAEETSQLFMKYLGDLTTELLLMHLEGNEPDNGRSNKIEDEVRDQLKKLIKSRCGLLTGGVAVNAIMPKLEESLMVWVRSIVSDKNQSGTELESRTDDLTPTLYAGYRTPSAILGIQEEAADDVIYNLQGMRVKAPFQPGLYIVNGKKVLK